MLYVDIVRLFCFTKIAFVVKYSAYSLIYVIVIVLSACCK